MPSPKISSSSSSSCSSQRVDDREVVVDDEVHERVEDEARPLGEELRVALAARADLGVGRARRRGGRSRRSAGRRRRASRRTRSCRPRAAAPCAGRRTASRRTPRASDAGARCARPRSPGRAARTPPGSSAGAPRSGSCRPIQTNCPATFSTSLMSSSGTSPTLRPVGVGGAVDDLALRSSQVGGGDAHSTYPSARRLRSTSGASAPPADALPSAGWAASQRSRAVPRRAATSGWPRTTSSISLDRPEVVELDGSRLALEGVDVVEALPGADELPAVGAGHDLEPARRLGHDGTPSSAPRQEIAALHRGEDGQPREPEDRRRDVEAAGEPACRAGGTRPGAQTMSGTRRASSCRPMWRRDPVLAERLAVVGGDDDDRTARRARAPRAGRAAGRACVSTYGHLTGIAGEREPDVADAGEPVGIVPAEREVGAQRGARARAAGSVRALAARGRRSRRSAARSG